MGLNIIEFSDEIFYLNVSFSHPDLVYQIFFLLFGGIQQQLAHHSRPQSSLKVLSVRSGLHHF